MKKTIKGSDFKNVVFETIPYDDLPMDPYPLFKSYRDWINEELTSVKVEWLEKEVKITSSSSYELIKAVLFIGYACGMAENGR